MLNNILNSFMKYLCEFQYMFLNCINYIYVCGNFISTELYEFLIFDQIRMRSMIRLKRIFNFWCSMLVYAPFALCFVTLCGIFYAFSRTNLLTRHHSASSLFSATLCFRKATPEIFSELDKTKAKIPIFPKVWRGPKLRRRGARGRPHHPMARATPWSHWGLVWAPGPPRDAALLPIYSPRREILKGPINFPRNILQVAAVVDVRSGGSRSSFRHPTREGNHYRRPSSSPCLPLEWCMSSLLWTTGP
jgi:hypothetical protein